MTQALEQPTHPILAATRRIGVALDEAAGVNPVFMDTGEKATALRSLSCLEARLDELRLRILAGAGDVAATIGSRDVASWQSAQLHMRHEDARADADLAAALDRRYPTLAAAMADGMVNRAQALVIVRALDALPGDLEPAVLVKAEAHLVDHCGQFGPKVLARLGRRILEVVAPEIAEAVQARRLAEMEKHAEEKTRLSLRALGDGTTRISGLLPDATAARLGTYLEAFTNPRRDTGEDTTTPAPTDPASTSPATGRAAGPRLPYPRKLGRALCAFLEAVDSTRLPVHGGDATTVIVTLSLEDLRTELATADLTGILGLPGDPVEEITAAQARRLACTAHLIPAVLGGDSEILDLGRSRRLFTRAQRKALMLRDGRCRAEGCDIPAPWTEAHHLDPWSRGGPTDLRNAVSLCSHHHHRAHDTGYRTQRLPNGDLRFHRRT